MSSTLLSAVERRNTAVDVSCTCFRSGHRSGLKVDQGTRMLKDPHLRVLFVVQSEAADGVSVFDGRGTPGALETETRRWRELGVQLVGQVPHHTQGILQTLETKEEESVGVVTVGKMSVVSPTGRAPHLINHRRCWCS